MGSRAVCRWLHTVVALLAWPVLAGALPDAPRHEGVATCASSACHGRAEPVTGDGILGNEYVTWASFDPHARAYATLLGERSRAMAARLGLGDAHQAPECLSCHTDYVRPEQRGARFQLDDGIGCEACHGGAERWLPTHYDVPRVTRAEMIADGLVPLEDPATRAGVCIACHVGDGGARFVTHAMMAAGHPRLGFELDTFTELWRTSGGREHHRRDEAYQQRKPLPPPAVTWETGLLAQAGQYLAVVDGHYGTSGVLPDFALFNCYSCHRSMGIAQWADRTLPAGLEPGALRLDDSSLRMLQTVLAARGETALVTRIGQETTQLHAASASGRAALRSATAALGRTLAGVAAAFAVEPLGEARAGRALEQLARDVAAGAYPDYVHAEQAAMALVILLEASGREAEGAVDAVFRALEDDDRYDPGRFGQALQRIRAPGR